MPGAILSATSPPARSRARACRACVQIEKALAVFPNIAGFFNAGCFRALLKPFSWAGRRARRGILLDLEQVCACGAPAPKRGPICRPGHPIRGSPSRMLCACFPCWAVVAQVQLRVEAQALPGVESQRAATADRLAFAATRRSRPARLPASACRSGRPGPSSSGALSISWYHELTVP